MPNGRSAERRQGSPVQVPHIQSPGGGEDATREPRLHARQAHCLRALAQEFLARSKQYPAPWQPVLSAFQTLEVMATPDCERPAPATRPALRRFKQPATELIAVGLLPDPDHGPFCNAPMVSSLRNNSVRATPSRRESRNRARGATGSQTLMLRSLRMIRIPACNDRARALPLFALAACLLAALPLAHGTG